MAQKKERPATPSKASSAKSNKAPKKNAGPTTEIVEASSEQQELDASIAVLQSLLAKQQAQYGEDDAQLTDTMCTLASLLAESGKLANAISLCAKALEIRTRRFGRDSLIVSRTTQQLAELHEQNNNHVEAEKCYSTCLTIAVKTFGSGVPETVKLLSRLRHVISLQGRNPDEADRFAAGVANSSMNDALDEFPWDHHREIGQAALRVRNYKEAERVFSCLRDVTIALSPNSVHFAESLDLLSETYHGQRRDEEAFRLREKALHKYELLLGPDHGSVGQVLLRSAEMHIEIGQLAEAHPLLERAARVLETAFGERHSATMSAQKKLAEVSTKLAPGGQRSTIDLARKRLEKMYAARPKILATAVVEPSASTSATTKPVDGNEADWQKMMTDGQLALDRKNFEEAEKLFVQTVEAAQQFAANDRRLWDSMCQLAAAYAQTGKLYKSASAYQKVLKLCEEAHGPDSPSIVPYLELVGKSYRDQGELIKALECYERIVTTYISANAPAAVLEPFQRQLHQLQTEM